VIDPGSPSGKEYAIPLESARRDAAGTKGDVQQGERSAPLFGAGVGDSDDNGSGGTPESSGGHKQKSSRGPGSTTSAGSGDGGTVNDAIRSTQPVRATVPQGGLGSSASIAAVALSVLLLGGVIGSIARRRSN
jgi:hypothetical protein